MKKPAIEELWDETLYTKLAELPYNDMVTFVQKEFGIGSPTTRLYIGLNILVFLVMLALGIWQIRSGFIDFWALIAYVFLGFCIVLSILIPVHEAIHGLAYKILGAPKVNYGANLRNFYFYAVADGFVLGRSAFQFLALAPFVLISIAAIAGIAFAASVYWQWILWGVLLMHVGACAGDFGMLGFYARHKEGNIFTYDDVPGKVAYFFQEKRQVADSKI